MLPLLGREDIAPGSGSTAQEIGESRGQGSTIGIDVSASGSTLKLREDVGPVGIEPTPKTNPILRERKQNSPEALSNSRAVVFSGFCITPRVASPIAEEQADVVLRECSID